MCDTRSMVILNTLFGGHFNILVISTHTSFVLLLIIAVCFTVLIDCSARIKRNSYREVPPGYFLFHNFTDLHGVYGIFFNIFQYVLALSGYLLETFLFTTNTYVQHSYDIINILTDEQRTTTYIDES